MADSKKVIVTGPPLGNIPFSDNHIRVRQNFEALYTSIKNVFGATQNQDLTPDQLAQIQKALEANGQNPLNITALPGITLSPQKGIVYGTHASRLQFPLRNGVLWTETDRQQALYYGNQSAWKLIAAASFGAFENRYGDLSGADEGFIWYENSRNNIQAISPLLTFRWSGSAWSYIEGTVARNQNQIAVLAATLGVNDMGLLVNVLDYSHVLKWNQTGNAWNWAPGDEGSGKMVLFEVDPTSNGWHLYDGSNVSYLQGNGALGTVTLPDLVSNNNVGAYPKAGSPNGGPFAAVAPSFSYNATPAGNVVAVFNGVALAAHGHETVIGVNGNGAAVLLSGFGLGSNHSSASIITTVPSVSTSQALLTSNNSAGTPAGTIAAAFNGFPLDLNANLGDDGQPRNIVRRPFFRQ